MKNNYVYLKLSSEIDKEIYDKMFAFIFRDKKYNYDFKNDIISLSFEGDYKTLINFEYSIIPLAEDLQSSFKVLIVPFLNEAFSQYIEYCEDNRMTYLFELENKVDNFYKSLAYIFMDVDIYTLKTIKTYIEVGNSPSIAGYKLYVHRNTVTYRVERFSQMFDVDLSVFPTCVFVYKLIEEKVH